MCEHMCEIVRDYIHVCLVSASRPDAISRSAVCRQVWVWCVVGQPSGVKVGWPS